MIPLRDLERRPGIPFVTASLIFVNVVVWIYVLTLVDRPPALLDFYDRWSFDPAAQLRTLAEGPRTLGTLAPFVTHQFLHAGWLHIVGNMLFLWVFGAALERRMGAGPYLVFYLFAGCVAAVAQGAFELSRLDTTPLVGASGAISGVLGAYIVVSPAARIRALVPLGLFVTVMTLPSVLVLGEWFVLQIIATIGVLRVVGEETVRVAYVAHVAGFVTGAVLFGLARIDAFVRRSRARPATA